MSDNIRYETDLSGARWKLSKLKGMPFLMARKLNYWGSRTVEQIMRNLGGSILNTRTAHLKRNVGYKAVESEGTHGIVIGTGPDVGKREVKYASIHEHGGTIRPKRVKNLTIPLGSTKGTVAMHPEALSPKGRLNVMKTRTGKLIIFARTARGIKPLFLLKKEVRIPPRYWLSRSIGEMKTMLDMMIAPQQIIEDLFAGGERED
jgi:hypothetical protein